MSKPWTVDRSDIVISDRWIHLRSERVTTGRGAVLDPYYVISYPDWAVCIALTEDDRLVMVRQYRHGTASIAPELPGGCVDPHDPSPAEAAARELMEETGYGGGELVHVGSMAANPALQTNRIQIALMTGARRLAEPQLEPGEELSVELVPLEEALSLAVSGGMEQSMHVAALFAAVAALGRLKLLPPDSL
ncbi:NUDIX hydrolase [Gellertiella hungarica]|uniref:8-oxo-dGTP pyrophosphatase MutT (NUDIX family) n=1 Tax=Gellertiella hungarica TaxID=1572859 RepID=A0A7W6J1N0_9HYPH|nr:NUDIX hydrolase [Gellertiella hungarica]MBB4063149.1 8-oxo-dGTP pyrophosphatase MutT (NUDIX family) [Gellertiella hungarica]